VASPDFPIRHPARLLVALPNAGASTSSTGAGGRVEPPSSGGAAPAPLERRVLEALGEVVGQEGVLADAERLLVYESDGLTQYRAAPAAVVLPADADEVQGVLRILHRERIPMIPRGAGTGLSGGAIASAGGVVVGTARMNRILEVDPVNRVARVQPGVVNASLTRATLPHGLLYAPDPSSQSACTLGGNVAENSGGPHCLKYGVTSRYVRALEVVLPSGERVTLGGPGAAGELDLAGVFVGSEGCFGLAVEIEVGLIPAPRGVRTLLGIFPSMEAAGRAVTDIMARGLLPAALEIVDRETIRAVEASIYAAGFPTDAGAALVVEFDGIESGLDDEVSTALEACRGAGASEVRTATDEAERAALWRGRKKAFGAMGRIAPDLLVQDATVPRSQLPAVLARIAEIGTRHRLRVANVFHAGDGNLHPNLLFDRRDADELARVEAASTEIMAVCIEAGGTITGEHGVGIDKRKYLPLVCPPAVLRAMGEVRRAFDPEGLSNPGKVLPDGWGPPGPPRAPERVAEGAPDFRAPGGVRILDIEPADLVCRTEGGVTLDALSRAAAAHGQWLPFDPPGDPAVLTLERALLAGRAGPLQAGYGRMRDHVLGLCLEARSGERLSLGGRVVKNVAGFDLVRLVVGSAGRLGRITEATVRLFPLPASDRTLFWRSGTIEEGLRLGRALAARGLPVAALNLYRGGSVDDGGGVAARLHGSSAAVDEMAEDLETVAGSSTTLEGEASRHWWRDRAKEADSSGRPGSGSPPTQGARVAGRASDAAVHLALLEPLLEAPGSCVSVHLLDGGIDVRFGAETMRDAGGRDGLRARIAERGGRLLFDGEAPDPDDPVRERLHRHVAQVFEAVAVGGAP
jgi:glycolate oxidase subunit GlcD